MTFPEQPLDRDAVLGHLRALHAGDTDWRDGQMFAYIYDPGRAAEEVAADANRLFLGTNALDPTVFPSVLGLETELVRMVASLLGGGPSAVGNFTSGGTESIMLAVKAARDHARARRPDLARPELVLPVTAHAAFHKAADYLGLTPVMVPVDPATCTPDPDAIRRAVTDDTALIVASAPSFAHGVVDPIADIGAVALERDVPFHVDACVGGFLLPFFRRLGADVAPFDLSVPGVTTLSVDLHKYAFAPRGASLLLHRDDTLRRRQIFACAEWTGYTVVNTAVQSSRSAGPLAAAWATVRFLGGEGYLALARKTLDATRRLIAGVEAIDGLSLMGRPNFSMIAAVADGFSVFHVVDEMKARGWTIQAQLAYDETLPENLHFSVNPGNAHQIDAMLADLADAVEAAKQLPTRTPASQVAAALATLTPADLDGGRLAALLGQAGLSSSALPDRMAFVSELLNGLPRTHRERLLVEYINQIFR